MTNLPFTYTHAIVNNVLTIIFDFSSLSYRDFYNLKWDYFSQGLVINESGFDMSFAVSNRVQRYSIEVERFDNGKTPVMRLMGTKIKPSPDNGYHDEICISLS